MSAIPRIDQGSDELNAIPQSAEYDAYAQSARFRRAVNLLKSIAKPIAQVMPSGRCLRASQAWRGWYDKPRANFIRAQSIGGVQHRASRCTALTPKDKLTAVDNISFDLYPGQTLGVVGESGCGKSTLARAIIRMLPAETGQVLWLGQDLLTSNHAEMKEKRRDLQMIFQDPLASLDPRMTIGEIVAESLKTHFPKMSKSERWQRSARCWTKLGSCPI